MIKLRMLRWEINLDYLWVQCNHKGRRETGVSRVRCEGGTLLALKMERVALSQGMQAASVS